MIDNFNRFFGNVILPVKHIAVAVLIALNGCVAYYHPMTVGIPLIEEAGDEKIEAGYSFMGFAQGAYSYGLTDKLAVQAFGNIDFLSRFYIQGAAGLYKWYEKSLTGIELYGGYGFGSCIFRKPRQGVYYPSGNYHLLFSQFNIGKVEMSEANIDLGFGLKGGYLFSNYVDRLEKRIIRKDDGMIIEPSAMFRFEIREVKYSVSFNYVFPVTISKQALFYPFNVGVARQF